MPALRNEAQTRFELIDPVLIDQRGWRREDILLETTDRQIDIVYGKGQRRPAGRTDYLLCRPLAVGTERIPLAIVEAKREGLPAEHGLQQGQGYRIGKLHHVPFVFSSNGHQFVEYDDSTGLTSEARPMDEFPRPEELLARYLAARGLPGAPAELAFLTTPYAQGRGHLRYYQDAAIRSTVEKIIRQQAAGEPPRVLLSLATGAGKTRLAAVLLKKLFDAGKLGRALFVCDRTELRDNGLADFQAAFGTDAAEVTTREPQKNARVCIATYQTLDKSGKGEDKDSTFFLKHYPAGFFDVIVIDECHRSAWGDWHVVLEKNKQAIQIGLTATPREIEWPEDVDAETQEGAEEDRRRLADNVRYFGEAAYEYPYLQGVEDGYLAPAKIETFDIYHDGKPEPERIRGVTRSDLLKKKLTDLLTGQKLTADAVAPKNAGGALEAWLVMPERVSAMCGHFFAQLLAIGAEDATGSDPLQKTIIFCASDHHADLVAIELNNLYARWCRANGRKRVQTYAFKCMSSVNGQALIPTFRGRHKSHFIATTKDLLSTGVNVPCVRNIVFFRYLNSPILFHQMIGRGTRIDEGTDKLMFRIFDYTGATALLGAAFITPPPPPEPPPGPPQPPPPPRPKVKARGVQIDVKDAGEFYVMGSGGQMQRVTPQQYQQRLIDELAALVPSLADFRARWLDATQRQELMKQLERQGFVPATVREAVKMDDYDLFDILAALAYGITPRSRRERAAQFGADGSGPEWLIHLPQPTAKVIRAIVRQFEKAGTDALEAGELWQTPEIKKLRGVAALSQGGNPGELMRQTKETLFVA
jgi:type I restriction enzyme R subunit